LPRGCQRVAQRLPEGCPEVAAGLPNGPDLPALSSVEGSLSKGPVLSLLKDRNDENVRSCRHCEEARGRRSNPGALVSPLAAGVIWIASPSASPSASPQGRNDESPHPVIARRPLGRRSNPGDGRRPISPRVVWIASPSASPRPEGPRPEGSGQAPSASPQGRNDEATLVIVCRPRPIVVGT
jgi:hypothetical protein